MNILIYGAGVVGSLYAARLKESGQNASILARGQRFDDLRQHGIVIKNPIVGKSTTTYVHVVDSLASEDIYELIMVFVRKNQLTNILPVLTANHDTPSILFMLNNATGPGQMIAALGCQRVLIGFPGVGGTREGNITPRHRATGNYAANMPRRTGWLFHPARQKDCASFEGGWFPNCGS